MGKRKEGGRERKERGRREKGERREEKGGRRKEKGGKGKGEKGRTYRSRKIYNEIHQIVNILINIVRQKEKLLVIVPQVCQQFSKLWLSFHVMAWIQSHCIMQIPVMRYLHCIVYILFPPIHPSPPAFSYFILYILLFTMLLSPFPINAYSQYCRRTDMVLKERGKPESS